MQDIIKPLLYRLCDKGLSPSQIPYLIRDTLYMIHQDELMELPELNRKLNELGWMRDLLDTLTFVLILYLLEE